MASFLNAFTDTLAKLDARSVFDILLIAAVFYWMLMLIRGTTAMTLLRGAAILIIAAVILAQTLDLKVLDFIIRNSFAGLLVGILVVFQPEIRRALERLGAPGTLPLAENARAGHVGTRHRAALGISERTDAVSVVVSEQTGDISVASNGRMVSRLDETRLRATLASLLGQPPLSQGRR